MGVRPGAPFVNVEAVVAELDLMARIAGLRLHGRYGGWRRRPFTSDATMHVSVYGR